MKEQKECENRLHPDNCNKAQCKTCIFGEQPVVLAPGRMAEIQIYLATGKATHICHSTHKTCYGALQFQSEIFHKMGLIPNPTVESLLSTASKYLGLNKPSENTEEEKRQRNHIIHEEMSLMRI